MKTGIIVYVVGGQEMAENFDEKMARQGLNVNADRVEFVFSGEKNYDLADAWWAMTRKGMRRIVCMAGELADASRVSLTGRELQLCAY